MSKSFLGIIVGIIIVVVGIIIVSNHNASAPSGEGTPTSHIKGNKKSPVRLVEYGDYQCPGCGSFYATVKAVNKKYDSKISFQFINFPLVNIHPNTLAASRAAEAAGLQGKYWQMHDVLYEQNQYYYIQQQQTWITASNPVPLFNNYAASLRLNMTKFKKDYKSERVNNWIQADRAKGDKAGVDATPTFFLNGKKLDLNDLYDSNGQPSVAAFSKIIDKALAQADKKATDQTTTKSTDSKKAATSKE